MVAVLLLGAVMVKQRGKNATLSQGHHNGDLKTFDLRSVRSPISVSGEAASLFMGSLHSQASQSECFLECTLSTNFAYPQP